MYSPPPQKKKMGCGPPIKLKHKIPDDGYVLNFELRSEEDSSS